MHTVHAKQVKPSWSTAHRTPGPMAKVPSKIPRPLDGREKVGEKTKFASARADTGLRRTCGTFGPTTEDGRA